LEFYAYRKHPIRHWGHASPQSWSTILQYSPVADLVLSSI
jgi:hypothetical protein